MNHKGIIAQRMGTIPLSLYVHFPWCLSKCPYCDFNSYPLYDKKAISKYVEQLQADLDSSIMGCGDSELVSIYFGGGTPSLLSPQEMALIIKHVKKYFSFVDEIEITLEANPGTINLELLQELRKVGINRISLGIQSFNDKYLKNIKRIHNAMQVQEAINAVKSAGFTNFNIDLMYGLPGHNSKDAVEDLKTALSFKPSHISWYQLTLDSDSKLIVPGEDEIWDIQQTGQDFLSHNGFEQYEVSAYCRSVVTRSKHNMNYWQYGDYIGIGAGAHSKLTFYKQTVSCGTQVAAGFSLCLLNYDVKRYVKVPNPIKYIEAKDFVDEYEVVPVKKIPLEFMLNALRLYQPITYGLFQTRTGSTIDAIKDKLEHAQKLELIELQNNTIVTTTRGRNFLDDLLEIFL